MTQLQKTSFVVFSGIISDLQIVNDEKDFILNPALRNSGKLATVGLAITDVAGAAATALQSSTGSEASVQFFRCKIGKETVTGCFSVVFFNDSDYVDVVAEKQSDDTYYAYAVRRPIDHRLWLPFNCERGSKAYKRARVSISKWLTLICCTIPITIFLLFMTDYKDPYEFIIFPLTIIMASIFMFILFYHLYGHNYLLHSTLFEKILSTLGYEKTAMLDMNHEHSQFLRDTKEHGEFYYVEDTYQYKQMPIAPFVYHYRIAPEIPESSKLK